MPVGDFPTANINGREVYSRKYHISGLAVAGLAGIGIVLAVLAYFYISHLLRKAVAPRVPSRMSNVAHTSDDTEAGGGTTDQSEKNSLMAWMRRRSRGRFADTTGSHRGGGLPPPPPLQQRSSSATLVEKPPGQAPTRMTSFFSRISIVPHLAAPPRAHNPDQRQRPAPPTGTFPSTVSSGIRRPNLHAAPTLSPPLAHGPHDAQSHANVVRANRTPLRSQAALADAGRSRSVPVSDPKVLQLASRLPGAAQPQTQGTQPLQTPSRSAPGGEGQRSAGATDLPKSSKTTVTDQTQGTSNGSPVREVERSGVIEDKTIVPGPKDSAAPVGEGRGERSPRSRETPAPPF
ncbi:hypothetical protein LshimejAT787_1102230 [Lyophyllum shimeji]|uniref:Uncharacterized protein n=1 Tax=Lyophyllum shimeji TaxID=47721 RepID=A0A9P3PUE9_LYOSH|nr:hypothetical protein LshimejAT787_1102230 [Lyophyllum shimeji]